MVKRKILMTGLFLFGCVISSALAQDKFELVSYSTVDGKIEAAFFNAGTEKVVIFAHGAIFNKESWYFLAEKFQEIGVSSLCIDFRGYGNSTATDLNHKSYDILGAIKYLEQTSVKEIDIVGASMGAAAVLEALTYKHHFPISKVVLLAPAGGPAINSQTIKKLFVISKNEGLYNRVISIYYKSTGPKILKEYDGEVHAQHLFKTNHVDDLTSLIINFIKE